MNAGKLRERITIQQREKKKKPSGQVVGDWVDLCTVWAQVKCTNSKTVDSSGVVQHETVYRFYIRWRSEITAEMRVVWNGRIFELTGPPADWKSEKIGLTLLTKEQV